MTAPAVVNADLVMRHAGTNEYYRRAVETPEYVEAVTLRNKAIQLRAELAPVPKPPSPLGYEYDPAKLDDLIDGWLDQVVRFDDIGRELDVRRGALNSLVNQCDIAIQGIVFDKNPQLASLAKDLGETMATIAEVVERLDGAHTPSEVIAASKADVWNELRPLHDQYDSIRQAQDWIMAGDARVQHRRSEYLWDDDLATDLAIANLDDIFPDWRSPAQNTMAIRNWETHARSHGRKMKWHRLFGSAPAAQRCGCRG